MQPPRKNILPKISTMPRKKSEATDYLDLYQLAVEKERLQQELQKLEQRQQQIQQRLVKIDSQMNQLKNNSELEAGTSTTQPLNSPQVEANPSTDYDTFTLEY